MPLESFLDKIKTISEEEKKLKEEGFVFFQAISTIATYKQNKNETIYEPRDQPLTLGKAKEMFKPPAYEVTKAYYWDSKENPNAFWVYVKK